MIEILLGISLGINVILFLRLRVASTMKKNEDNIVDYLLQKAAER